MNLEAYTMLEFRNLTNGAPVYRLPDTDVHEENGELILRAEMPGLHFGECDLIFETGDLVLDADGWNDSLPGREHYEHLHGRLPLPFGIDPDKVSAQVEDDVLEVHIPLPLLPDGEAWLPGDEIAY